MSDRARRRAAPGPHIALAVFGLAALEFCLRTLDIRNDQFGRISPGRQILVLHESPFRDFLDPGYFLTEFSSAAVQWLFGQNLLGELLLNSVFIATGVLCVCLVARRLTNRLIPSVVAGVFALLAVSRAYDYDKALFYPLGLLLIFRWLEKPSSVRALTLALALVVSAMYRYDNGVFIGVAALTGVLVVCSFDGRRLLTVAGPAAAMVVALSAPVLLWLSLHGGVGNAADQALTYGLREGDRTRITSLPRLHHTGPLLAVGSPPLSRNHVRVRWSMGVVSDAHRHQLAARLGLADEQAIRTDEGRTWAYTLPDASVENIRRLVNDPLVEDTDGIDRGQLRLIEPEPGFLRWQRLSPAFRIRVLPGFWTFDNVSALLYYELMALPLLCVVTMVRARGNWSPLMRAQIAASIALCLLLCAFILRDPVGARVGGMAGPFCALTAWILGRLIRAAPRIGVVSTTVILVITATSLAVAVGWHRQLSVPFTHPGEIEYRLRRFAEVPPSPDLLPSGRVRGIVDYVRDCTLPDDRIFVSWFAPEVFYFAQRGFGGAMAATFGGHWQEPRFQRRSIEAFDMHSTPIVIIQKSTAGGFRTDYRLLDEYLSEHYRPAGSTDFGDPEASPDGYQVLVRAERAVTRTDSRFGLPCFAEPQSL